MAQTKRAIQPSYIVRFVGVCHSNNIYWRCLFISIARHAIAQVSYAFERAKPKRCAHRSRRYRHKYAHEFAKYIEQLCVAFIAFYFCPVLRARQVRFPRRYNVSLYVC